MHRPISIEQATGLAIVLAMHAFALWGLWQHRLIPGPGEAMTLFVNFVTPPVQEKKKEEPMRPPPPKPRPTVKPQQRQLVAETPVVAPNDYVAPPPPPNPAPEPAPAPLIAAPAPPPAPPAPAGPVSLDNELSVACPERTPPSYPPASRRLGEEGTVVLRVELDERGQVSGARVATSSGFARLDKAALNAVRTWHCNPAQRNGQPVRATALQPFKFVLQGN